MDDTGLASTRHPGQQHPLHSRDPTTQHDVSTSQNVGFPGASGGQPPNRGRRADRRHCARFPGRVTLRSVSATSGASDLPTLSLPTGCADGLSAAHRMSRSGLRCRRDALITQSRSVVPAMRVAARPQVGAVVRGCSLPAARHPQLDHCGSCSGGGGEFGPAPACVITRRGLDCWWCCVQILFCSRRAVARAL